MKIDIEHRGVRRQIRGTWGICGSRADLLAVVQAITDKLGRTEDGAMSYGWVEIREPEVTKPGDPALDWQAGA